MHLGGRQVEHVGQHGHGGGVDETQLVLQRVQRGQQAARRRGVRCAIAPKRARAGAVPRTTILRRPPTIARRPHRRSSTPLSWSDAATLNGRIAYGRITAAPQGDQRGCWRRAAAIPRPPGSADASPVASRSMISPENVAFISDAFELGLFRAQTSPSSRCSTSWRHTPIWSARTSPARPVTLVSSAAAS